MRKALLLIVGTIVLVIAECLLFVYLVTVGWEIRGLMLHPGDPEIAVRTRTVYANGAWLALNLIGLAGYLYRKEGLGRSGILIVLAFDILNSLFAAAGFILTGESSTAVQWLLLTLIPIAALVLVLVLVRPKAPSASR